MGETTVLRGGYGIFYEGEYTDGRVNLFMPPFLLQDSALNDRGVIPNRTLADFYLGAPLGSPNSTIGLTPEYTHMRMGYDQHWNFGIQQQLSKTMVADIEYVGNKGSNIQGNNGFNIPAPAAGRRAGAAAVPALRRVQLHLRRTFRPPITPCRSKLERRLSAGLWLLGSYTFSKSLWNTNTPAVGGMFAFEKGPSEYQVPHSFSFSFGYELPFGKGKPVFGSANRLANGVIGGWQLQGIMIFRSGVPFTVTMSRDVANTGVGGQRPNRIGVRQVGQPDAGAVVRPGGFRGRAQLHLRKLRAAHPLAGHPAHRGFLAVQAVPDRRALAPAIPLGGVQSSEHAELRGAQLDTGYGHRGAGHQHRYRAAPNAGSLEADILTP